jgi:hypothetical protein
MHTVGAQSEGEKRAGQKWDEMEGMVNADVDTMTSPRT